MGLGALIALQYKLFVIIWFEGISVAYARLIAAANLDVDSIHGKPSWWAKFKVVMVYTINVGSMKPPVDALPLVEEASPHVRGLVTTWREGKNASAEDLKPDGAIVVGTIRMGYGHHRIAYATTSWALGMGKKTYFHDLLGLDSEEAGLIKTIDKFYSQISRIQAEFRAIELIWGYLTANGANADLARQFALVSAHFQTLMAGFPRDTPIISTFPCVAPRQAAPTLTQRLCHSTQKLCNRTHSGLILRLSAPHLCTRLSTSAAHAHRYVGLAAVACGFTKVINLVFDNHAQSFHIVPGAINLIQGPTMCAAS